MPFSRIYSLTAAVVLACTPTFAAAQTQFRVLVGYPPGGAQNFLARVFA